MKLLANENFPISSVRILKEAGYDIISVGQDFAGILDHEVIALGLFSTHATGRVFERLVRFKNYWF